MDDGAGRYPASSMRASDADRDAVLAELSEHFQAGRLTSDELEERTQQALRARTFADLASLLADLPSSSTVPAAGLAADAAAGPGREWPSALAPVVLGMVAVVVVAGVIIGTLAGAGGSSLWWLILIVPLVARRRLARSRR